MKLDLPNQKTRIVIKGLNRVNILEYKTEEDNLITALTKEIEIKELNKIEEIAYSRSLISSASLTRFQESNLFTL